MRLTDQPIDVSAVLGAVASSAAGAVVLFLGTARETTAGRKTEALVYECYREMAEKKLAQLEAEAKSRWELVGAAIVHRLGRLKPGEVSVAIAASAAHRQVAFEAGKWLIDRIKETVPIWKQECWADGTCEWVHPGLDAPSSFGEV